MSRLAFITRLLLAASCLLASSTSAQVEPPPVRIRNLSGCGSQLGQFWIPTGLGTDAAGDLYVCEEGNKRIQKFSSAGVPLEIWAGTGSGGPAIGTPFDIAFDPSGNAWVVSQLPTALYKLTPDGELIASYVAGLTRPVGVDIGPDGQVWIVDNRGAVVRYTPQGFWDQELGGGVLSIPQGIAVGPDNTIYVADTGNDCIRKFSSAGHLLATWTGFSWLTDVDVDAGGCVFATEYYLRTVTKLDANGTLRVRWQASVSEAAAVTVDAAGRIHVAGVNSCNVATYADAATGVRRTTWGQLKVLHR